MSASSSSHHLDSPSHFATPNRLSTIVETPYSRSGTSTPRPVPPLNSYMADASGSITPTNTIAFFEPRTVTSVQSSTILPPESFPPLHLPPSSPTHSAHYSERGRPNDLPHDGMESEGGRNPSSGEISSSSEGEDGVGAEERVLPTSEDVACQGQRIHWTPGNLWMTYCFQQHNRTTFPFQLHSVESREWIRIQSRVCLLSLDTDGEKQSKTCSRCQALANSPRVHAIMERATKEELPPKTPYQYLSTIQSQNRMRRLNKQLNGLRLQVSHAQY